jgi:DNA repair protein RadD
MLIPRDYQEEGLRCLLQFFADHKEGNPVVAMPTGTGKAYEIALFLHRAFAMYSKQKMLVMTHVKELIDQNFKEFLELWPTAPAGIYSAGLKRKDTAQPIIFCGVASVSKNIAAFGHVDIIIVDECHLISQDDGSMYLKVFAILKAVNPNLRIIGFTATPWRAGQGKITDDGIFTHMCFDVTDMRSFNRFIKEGYLAPLIPKHTETQLDVTGVHKTKGEFDLKELQIAVDKDEITFAALQEAIAMGRDRHCWLVFGAGIAHVEKIVMMLNYLGISARCVHSKMSDKERDKNIEDWKNGLFVAMVNNGVLTTGLNHKPIDFIIMLRPTHSVVLWVQMLGRGTRPYDYLTESKEYLRLAFPYTKFNCLVADFAGNTQRLGPINDPLVPRKRGEKTGEVPIKICDSCDTYNHISARFCGGKAKTDPEYNVFEGCGKPFEFKTLMRPGASTEELIKPDAEIIVEDFKVDTITFSIHQKVGKPDSIKVTYYCGLKKYAEYVLVEHEGFGRRRASSWWRERTQLPLPATTAEAYKLIDRLEVVTDIRVHTNKPHPEILKVSFIGAFEKKIIGDEIPF